MEKFTFLELQALHGGLIAEIALIEQTGMNSIGMKMRKAAAESALKKIKEEIQTRKAGEKTVAR